MPANPMFLTVVGYADMDDLETFSELVYADPVDSFLVAVDQAMLKGEPSRYFLQQATEIDTFVGICVGTGHNTPAIPSRLGPTVKIDPDVDVLYDLEIYSRTTPAEKEGDAPVQMFYWFDENEDEPENGEPDTRESGPWATYVDCLRDRYDCVCG